MIVLRGENIGRLYVDIEIPSDAAWNDSFMLPMNGTRPFTGWASVQLVILPTFDYPTPIRTLSSAGGSPEIIVDDAARGACHFAVPQSVVETIPPGEWRQFLRLVYPSDDADSSEQWRGNFRLLAGTLP